MAELLQELEFFNFQEQKIRSILSKGQSYNQCMLSHKKFKYICYPTLMVKKSQNCFINKFIKCAMVVSHLVLASLPNLVLQICLDISAWNKTSNWALIKKLLGRVCQK